ncbi:hypothetical protein BKK54_04160 [Rodentibacter genomosp. 1]|uniref:Uncharacterized protein n=1 Tax=Rodentibacter genomosp. 1 TaxID=1908264 RepID=A0A1V3J7I3_9PAST|nr:hypothetical protein [Rodentibacter genomosp. 1]OOF50898.1 hypothetical protein BKK54_04160 [Rodentibacter genomosp. 1]
MIEFDASKFRGMHVGFLTPEQKAEICDDLRFNLRNTTDPAFTLRSYLEALYLLAIYPESEADSPDVE